MPEVLVSRDGAVATVTLNRPDRRNALSARLLRELRDALLSIGRDATVHAVILAARGPVFSSGHDLGEMVGSPRAAHRRLFDLCTETMAAIQAIPQPVIAEVGGLATAAGCQLAASCDLVVAAEQAGFATPGVRIGLFCTTPMVALTRAVGRKRAMEMLLTGEPVDARTAADWGLVNRVVPGDELRAATRRLAGQIAAHSADAVAVGKRAFYAQVDLPQGKAYDRAVKAMSRNAAADDAQEGMAAFLEKRAPRWRRAASGQYPIMARKSSSRSKRREKF